METKVTELAESRVRVEARVPAEDVDRHVQRAARAMARDMRMPGFRKGKAPPGLVIQRLGFESVLQQALRDSLPEWYERAVIASGVSTVGDPEIELADAPTGPGAPLGFSFEVAVTPRARLGSYQGLEVGRADPEVPDDIVERELSRLREGVARLVPVERPAAEGDALLVDFSGAMDGEPIEGGQGRDELIEIGAGRVLEDLEKGLVGAEPGTERSVQVDFPDDYGAEELAGRPAVFEVTVKEVREKQLPDLDDDFAAEVSEFDTLEELRGDIREKLSAAVSERIEQDFRMAVIDAAAEQATIEIPGRIVEARAGERWQRVERQLAGRGIDPNVYLQVQGQTREQIVEESKPDAERDLRREATLAAVAEAEGIEVGEEEMVEALEHSARHERTTPEKLLDRLRREGRDGLVRDDLRTRKAIDFLVESAVPIPMARAEARERLWTPEEEAEPAGSGAPGSLWTPGER
ncbi:MAG: trigger factor [Solirubrobacterales bacterium]